MSGRPDRSRRHVRACANHTRAPGRAAEEKTAARSIYYILMLACQLAGILAGVYC